MNGGDAEKTRKMLCCLLKKGNISPLQKGLLIHALGNAFAHTKPGTNELYGPPFGHLMAGHTPDEIGADKSKYLAYVSFIYHCLGGKNDGFINDFSNYVNKSDFGDTGDVDAETDREAQILRNYPEFGYQGDLHPEGTISPPPSAWTPSRVNGRPGPIRNDDPNFGTQHPAYQEPTEDDVRGVMDMIRNALKDPKNCCYQK